MTDAEKAIEKLENHISSHENASLRLDTGEVKRCLYDIKATLKTQQNPAEVTVKEFNDLIDPQMPSFNNIGNLLLNRFPNGIKLIDGADHGP